MPVIPANQLIHVEAIVTGQIASGGGAAKTIISVFDFRRTATVLPVDKLHIDTAFQAAYVVPLGALQNAAYLQSQNSIRFLNDATDPALLVPHAVAGGVVGARSQDYDAVCYQYVTGYRGKSGRGSKHFAPLSEADALGDVLTGASLAAWVAFKAVLLAGFTDVEGNIWVPCVVSKGAQPPKSQLTINPTTVFSNDVTSIRLNKTLGTMRRRKVRTVLA